MIAVKENVLCMFGGVATDEEAFKTNTYQFLNDLYILDISKIRF